MVGDGYRLMASPGAPSFAGTSLNFRYLGREAPPGEESFLSVYYWDGVVWEKWRIYDKTAPGYVNQLHTLEFGKGYWFNVSEAITLYLKGASSQTLSDLSSGMGYPPATDYGPVMAGEGFTPVADLPVTAWVNGNVCGRGVTLNWQGQVVYTLDVFAEALDGSNSCGRLGQTVTFRVGEQAMAQSVVWDNRRVWNVPLSTEANSGWTVYLPLVLRQ